MSTSSVGEPTRRPGGRTAGITRRINSAVFDLLRQRGVEACTFAAVAEHAGIERSTLYRRYGDRWAMMIDAIVAYAAEQRPGTSLGSFREDLRLLVRNTAETLATPLGPAIWTVAAAMRAGAAPQHRGRYWQSRLAQVQPIMDAAKARGELPPNVETEELYCFALGAVHYRTVVLDQPPDDKEIDRIVERVCRLYCSGPVQSK